MLKLLPKARKVHRQPEYTLWYTLEWFERKWYEFRQSFSIDFNFSNWSHIDRESLLHLVAAFGSEEDYEKFITLSSLRPNVDFHNYHRQAIYIAFKYRNISLITYFGKYLQIYKDDMDKSLLLTVLNYAAEFGHVNILREIPAFEENHTIRWSDRRGNTHIHGGYLYVVKHLMEEVGLKYGIDPTAQGYDIIQYAALKSHLDMVKYLIDEVDSKYGINPAAQDNSIIRKLQLRGI